MIGRSLSHYRIVELRGAGGMGTVYRALDTLLGRAVALKFPKRELLHDDVARGRFLQEARAASALDHPNVVVLYDVCEVEGETFLAMQYVEGPTLRERLRKGPLPLHESAAIGRAVADALAHAHGRHVIHRDIKPENILLCSTGRTKVADFGLSRLMDDLEATRTAAAIGTPLYMAPEVAQGRDADERSDIFSLGVVLYEMLSGATPFQGAHTAEVLLAIVGREPAPLPKSVPEPLARLVHSMLQKSPGQRPASAVTVGDALLTFIDGGSPRQDAPTPDAAGSTERSIAVLRFENLTGSPEENYFCAGITEDLLTEIMQIPDLKVASRTIVEALGKGPVDLKRAARTLGVCTILEGGVRRAGGRVRVTARLVSTEDGYPIWAGRYDRSIEDIFDVQEEIARQIAEALRVAFQPRGDDERLGRRTKSARAYDLRLQALALSRKVVEEDMRAAIELLEEALREDPAYSLALADLAECRVQLYCKGWDLRRELLDRAEEEAGRARDAAPMLPEAYRAMGHLWNHRRRPERAVREFHHAVDLDPRFSSALTQLANVYVFLGDPTRGEVYVRRAMGLDPEDARSVLTLTRIMLRQGRYPECREAARGVVALHPSPTTLYPAYGDLVLASILDGTRGEIERVDVELRGIEGRRNSALIALSALTASHLGRADEARGLLADPSVTSSTLSDAHVFAARAYLILGERDLSLKALERAAALDYIDLRGLAADPQLAPLRSDPKFEQILGPRVLSA